MIEDFRQYLQERILLTEAEWEKINAVALVKKLEKGQHLLTAGETWKFAAFVCKGCIRTYRTDQNGKLRIINFVVENGWAGDTRSMQTNEPSVFSIDAIEYSEVLLINKGDMDMLCKQLPQLAGLVTENLKECLASSQSRVDLATSPSAEDKYRAFSTYHASLLQRIPQYMIASYLGMTPESLSRIRKKLAREQTAELSLLE